MKPESTLEALAQIAREENSPPSGEWRLSLGKDFEDKLFARLETEVPAASPVVPSSQVIRHHPKQAVWFARFKQVAPLALAASLTLFVVGKWRFSPTVPEYTLELRGQTAPTRSATESPAKVGLKQTALKVTAGSQLELVLRPVETVDVRRPLGARVFVVDDRGMHRLSSMPEQSAEGAFRFRLNVEDLRTTPGAFEVVGLVGIATDVEASQPDNLVGRTRMLRRAVWRE